MKEPDKQWAHEPGTVLFAFETQEKATAANELHEMACQVYGEDRPAEADRQLAAWTAKLIPELIEGVVYNGNLKCLREGRPGSEGYRRGQWEFGCTECGEYLFTKIDSIRKGLRCNHKYAHDPAYPQMHVFESIKRSYGWDLGGRDEARRTAQDA